MSLSARVRQARRSVFIPASLRAPRCRAGTGEPFCCRNFARPHVGNGFLGKRLLRGRRTCVAWSCPGSPKLLRDIPRRAQQQLAECLSYKKFRSIIERPWIYGGTSLGAGREVPGLTGGTSLAAGREVPGLTGTKSLSIGPQAPAYGRQAQLRRPQAPYPSTVSSTGASAAYRFVSLPIGS